MMRLRTAMSQWLPAAAKARPWNGLGGVRMGVWAFGCSCIEIMAARLLPQLSGYFEGRAKRVFGTLPLAIHPRRN